MWEITLDWAVIKLIRYNIGDEQTFTKYAEIDPKVEGSNYKIYEYKKCNNIE